MRGHSCFAAALCSHSCFAAALCSHSCFAAARAACVSTWLGEDVVHKNRLPSSQLQLAIDENGNLFAVWSASMLWSPFSNPARGKKGAVTWAQIWSQVDTQFFTIFNLTSLTGNALARLCLAPCRARSARRGSEAAAPSLNGPQRQATMRVHDFLSSQQDCILLALLL